MQLFQSVSHVSPYVRISPYYVSLVMTSCVSFTLNVYIQVGKMYLGFNVFHTYTSWIQNVPLPLSEPTMYVMLL